MLITGANQSQRNLADAQVNGIPDEDSQVIRAPKAPRETKAPMGENPLLQSIQSGEQKPNDSVATEIRESTFSKQTPSTSVIPSLLECTVTPPTNFSGGVQPAAFSMGSSGSFGTGGDGSGTAAGAIGGEGAARKKRHRRDRDRQRRPGSPHGPSAVNSIAANSTGELAFAPVVAYEANVGATVQSQQSTSAQMMTESLSANSTPQVKAASGTGPQSAKKNATARSGSGFLPKTWAQIASKNIPPPAPQSLPLSQAAPSQLAAQTTSPAPNPPSSLPASIAAAPPTTTITATTTSQQSSFPEQPPAAPASQAHATQAPQIQPISSTDQKHSVSARTAVMEAEQSLPKRSDKASSKLIGTPLSLSWMVMLTTL